MTTTPVEQVTEQPQSGADVLKRVAPVRNRGKVGLCLRPDLMDAWEVANAELQDATAQDMQKQGRLGSAGEVKMSAATRKKAQAVQALEAQISETLVWFTLLQHESWRFNQLKTMFPPKTDDRLDLLIGYNRDELVPIAIRESVVDPVFEDCEDPLCTHETCGTWQQLTTAMSPMNWDELEKMWREVNGASVGLPFSELASRILDSSSGSRSRRRGV